MLNIGLNGQMLPKYVHNYKKGNTSPLPFLCRVWKKQKTGIYQNNYNLLIDFIIQEIENICRNNNFILTAFIEEIKNRK